MFLIYRILTINQPTLEKNTIVCVMDIYTYAEQETVCLISRTPSQFNQPVPSQFLITSRTVNSLLYQLLIMLHKA